MTAPGQEGFVKLPNERILFTSPPRTSLEIFSPNTSGTDPFAAKSDAGVAYITNQRVRPPLLNRTKVLLIVVKIVYLPGSPTPELQSFSSPILRLHDTFARAPFFGANYWTASCKPVANGGIPPSYPLVELRLTFREGGAFDFHTTFEQIKERLYQAYTVARESGRRGDNVDMANVHLEQLPAYEPAREVEREEEERVILSPIPIRPGEARDSGVSGIRSEDDEESLTPAQQVAPDEPPPGYEEAQAQAVDAALERTLRAEARRQ